METKKILGLDLGTNSIGWAVIDKENENIISMGSRIIPMGEELIKFEKGQTQTKNANRRIAKGTRKLNKRYKQRRNKLIYVLQKLDMLPEQIELADPFINPLKLDRISILPIKKEHKQYTAQDLIELRVKALTQPVTLKEFGKIIYLFNQLRGYSGGGIETEKEDVLELEPEESIKKGKSSYTTFARVLSISPPEEIILNGKRLKKRKVKIETENGSLIGDTYLELLKEGESLELLINISVSKKYGETITIKLPNKTNWRKSMEDLEKKLTELSKEASREIYLSEYFLKILNENKWTKIRNNVILRSRYKSEFDAIWDEQIKHHVILRNLPKEKLEEILQFIFPGKKETQVKLRKTGLKKGLYYIIRDQIIYYQRELKDQSQLVSECRFEKGEKAIAKSHPIFQEFKIWEQINKLTINTKIENGINRKGEIKFRWVDRPIPTELKVWLFEELQIKREIGFSTVLNKLKKEFNLREETDFLNGMNTKAKLKGNETKWLIHKSLGEQLYQELGLSDITKTIELWDILYNAKGNEYDIESERTSKVLAFIKNSIPKIENSNQTAVQISKLKFNRSYAAISLKAINKILPVVRCGKYFNQNLTGALKETITRLLNENLTDPFEKAAQEYLENNVEVLLDGGIMNAYATILVYGKHTAKEYSENEIVSDFKEIKRLPQGELRNPLVEQIINETLMIIKDIWKEYGKPNEIRLELARELKNNAERRAKIYKSNIHNQNVNNEVKNLLIELSAEITQGNIEKYKLWLSQENQAEDYIIQYGDPSKSEIEKIKLWREQGHVSPYTGQPIPLSELFNRERYDVDHIIPQSRYFDDSFTNKIICEKSVNKEKGNRTAMEYFEVGSKIPSVLSKENYISHVNNLFKNSFAKRKNLLSTKVPEDPIARQLKETQYISVRVKEELNKIVGNENVKTTTGGITDYLRNQWGLTDKFKLILKERYEKMKDYLALAEYEKRKDFIKNKDTFLKHYSENLIEKKNNKLIIKGWSKRIDHRHHAIDALIVACTEPAHVKRLNDLNKELQTWLDNHKKKLLPDFEGSQEELLDEILNLEESKRDSIFKQIENLKAIDLPWQGFPEDAEKEINKIIVSQKPKDKLLIQADDKGRIQIKIRGQLHDAILYGKSQGIETYKVPLSKLADIDKVIVNDYLREVINEHIKEFINKKEAFNAEGILTLNKKLAEKKNKQGITAPHTPISAIKVYYRDPSKIKLKKGQEEIEETLQRLERKKAFNKSLYVRTGVNYLFAIMEKDGIRTFDIITFFDAANLLKEEFEKASNKKTFKKDQVFKNYFEEKNKAKLLFTLKQGDPVYMPAQNEELILDRQSPFYKAFWNDKEARSSNIHYVTQFSGEKIYFIKHNIANSIVNKKEFGSQNAYLSINGISIKQKCIKLFLDRLGNFQLI